MKNKKKNGQFFTITNPFSNDLFFKWIKLIPNLSNEIFLEPFSGSNNIVKMIDQLGYKNKWECFDIQPPELNNFPRYTVNKQDVLNTFPSGFNVCITNPPYLAKNSANRDGIYYPSCNYDDLYKYSLDVMLKNVNYAAAIIPESFITQNIFHNRLYGVISLTCKMFDDTDCPVCLALFVPESTKLSNNIDKNDFLIYKNSAYWGLFSQAEKNSISFELDGWKFNSPKGRIGLYAIDNTTEESIKFVSGCLISSEKIKSSSRGITRIDNKILDTEELDLDKLIATANKILSEYRKNTSDIFLTSFRGLRKDGNYRRRLDFNQAKKILSMAIKKELSYA